MEEGTQRSACDSDRKDSKWETSANRQGRPRWRAHYSSGRGLWEDEQLRKSGTLPGLSISHLWFGQTESDPGTKHVRCPALSPGHMLGTGWPRICIAGLDRRCEESGH